VVDRLEFTDWLAADTPGRAVGFEEVVLGLEFAEALEQQVVDPVGDQGVGLDVVAVIVFPNRLTELFGLAFGLRVGKRVDRLEFQRRVVEIGVRLVDVAH